ncbi:MAG: prepilin peptidase [Firmicutes bacterium]|nr:prepilin peptidase [Bacillota bacterium]
MEWPLSFMWGRIMPTNAGTYIEIRYPLPPNILKISVLLIGLLYGLYAGYWQETQFLWGCIIPATVAGLTDLKTYRLPNVFTIPILLMGILYGLYTGHWQASLLGVAVGVVFSLPWALLNQLGMGDVKLMAGLGAWLGPFEFMVVLFISCILGIIWSISRVVRQRETPIAKTLPDDNAQVPPNVIAFGFCLALGLWTNLILLLLDINLLMIVFKLFQG